MALVCLSTPPPFKLKETACLRGSNLSRTNPGFQLVSRLMQALKPGLSRLKCSTRNLGQVQTEFENFFNSLQSAFGDTTAPPKLKNPP